MSVHAAARARLARMQSASQPVPSGRPGRPAAATREEALALARARFLAGERIDVQAIARELGLARATMHRWFHTREMLLGEVMAALGEERINVMRERVGGSGPRALLDTFDAFNRELAQAAGLRAVLAQETELGLRVLTSGAGLVQPRMVAAVRALIEREVARGVRTRAGTRPARLRDRPPRRGVPLPGRRRRGDGRQPAPAPDRGCAARARPLDVRFESFPVF